MKKENIILIIEGKPWSNFEKYQKIINKEDLKSKILLLLGYNSEKVVAELFKLADLVVLPYIYFEASSGVGSIALYFEKPIVVTDLGGLTELVLNKNVIALPNDEQDLAEKIKYALTNLERLKKDSTKIKKKFSWKTVAQETIRVYKGLE